MGDYLEVLKPISILLVEDNPGDVRLATECFKDAKVRNDLLVVNDGEEAMKFLRKEGEYADVFTPDLILLDLNLPKKSGLEVLKEVKEDPDLKCLPVVVLTVSQAEQDIVKSYDLHANCFISKPVDLNKFIEVVKTIEDFWLTIVRFPHKSS